MHSAHEPTFSSLRPPGDSPPDAGDSIETDGAVVETRIFTQPTIPAENALPNLLAEEIILAASWTGMPRADYLTSRRALNRELAVMFVRVMIFQDCEVGFGFLDAALVHEMEFGVKFFEGTETRKFSLQPRNFRFGGVGLLGLGAGFLKRAFIILCATHSLTKDLRGI